MKSFDILVDNKYEFSLADKPKARTKGLMTQVIGDETLVYDFEVNKAHCLNNAAAIVWNSCDGSQSITGIVNKTEIEEHLVFMALSQLRSCELISFD